MEKLALTLGGTPINVPQNVPTESSQSLSSVLQLGFEILYLGAVLLTLFYLVWGGFDWISSEGNKQKLDQARQKVIFAVIGLTIVFLSFFIINVVQQFFHVSILAIPSGSGGFRGK